MDLGVEINFVNRRFWMDWFQRRAFLSSVTPFVLSPALVCFPVQLFWLSPFSWIFEVLQLPVAET